MKKTLKTIILSVILAVCLAFTGCGVSQSSADKINEAAKANKAMTITEVKKMCGDDEVLDVVGGDEYGSGVLIYVKGCDDWEDVAENLKAGKKMQAVVITCALGKATGAIYYEDYKGEKN